MATGKNPEKFWQGVHVNGTKILYLVNGKDKPKSSSSTTTTIPVPASSPALFGSPILSSVQPQGASNGSATLNRRFQNPNAQAFGVVEDEEEEGEISTATSNPIPSFFLGGNSNWKFNGEMCFNVESTSIFHLNISLTSGKSPEHVKMVMSISECQSKSGTFYSSVSFWHFLNVPIQLKIHFLDEHNKILQSNYIHMPTEINRGKRRRAIVNEMLMSTEMLLKLCQFKRKGSLLLLKRNNSNSNASANAENSKTDPSAGNLTDSEFEFVKCVIEVDIKLSGGNSNDLLKASSCDIESSKYLPSTSLSLNLKASTTPADLDFSLGTASGTGAGSKDTQPFVFTPPIVIPAADKKSGGTPGFNFIPPDAPRLFEFPTDSIQNLNLNSDEEKEKNKTKSKFSEVIKLTVGPNSQEFFIHREIFMKKSPVFERMLTVDMKEKTDGTMKLEAEDPETVQKFINYLYTEKLDPKESEVENSTSKNGADSSKGDLKCLDVVELLDLLKFAHMYEISDLVRDVTGLIIAAQNESLVLEVVLAVFLAGSQFDIPDLKFRALQWIKLNKSSVLSSEGQKVFKDFFKGQDEVVSNLLFHIL